VCTIERKISDKFISSGATQIININAGERTYHYTARTIHSKSESASCL
jgi:hypothetical protein